MWTQFLWNYLKQQSTLGLPLTEFLFWNLVFMIWTNKYFLCLYLSQDRWKIFFSSVVKMKSFDVRSTDLTFFISSLHIRFVYLQLLLIQSKISFCCGKVEMKWNDGFNNTWMLPHYFTACCICTETWFILIFLWARPSQDVFLQTTLHPLSRVRR